MSQTHLVDDLEIQQDLPFQQRSWMTQRIGWAIMGLILLAALLGLLGPGPFSDAVAGEENGPLWVEYHRFARFKSPDRLHVHWGPNVAGPDRTVRIWINKSYLVENQVQHVTPEPHRVLVSEDRVTYEFEVEDPAKPASAVFHLNLDQIGRAPVDVGLADGRSVSFWQFVYP